MTSAALPKVVMVTNIPAPYRVHQFRALTARARHAYLVYFCADGEPNRRWRVPGNFGFRHEFLHARPWTFLGGYSYFAPGLLFKLLRERPRVVLVGGFSMQLLLARLYGWVTGAGVIVLSDTNALRERDLPGWRTRLRKWLVRGIDGAIGCSQLGVDYLRQIGVPPDRIALSRIVNDAPAFAQQVRGFRAKRAEERSAFGIPADALVILFTGRLAEGKGVVELLDAFASVRARTREDLRLLVVGDGPLASLLRQRVDESALAECVHFVGFTPYEEVARFYALADLAVIPSLKEAYGLVVNEAVLARIPVLCSTLAGARDLIEDGLRGLLFDPRDPREFDAVLTDAVRRIADGGWVIPAEVPPELLADTANSAIEDLVDRVLARAPGAVAVSGEAS